MVTHSVAKKNTALETVCRDLAGPAIWKMVLATRTLKSVPVGVPPSRLAGVGMFTTSGEIEIPMLPAPGTEYSVDTPAPLSEIQKGLPELSEMPHGLTRWGSCTAATPGRSDTRLVWSTVPPAGALGPSAVTPAAGPPTRGREPT